MSDLGWRDGYCQMGSTQTAEGLSWVYALRGDECAPAAGTVNAWIAAPPIWTNIVMVTDYEPSYVLRFPVRAAVKGSEACSFPSIEADAIVSAGLARYA
jgi:hypothetical protein